MLRLSCDRWFELDVAAYELNKQTCIVSINDMLRRFLLDAEDTCVPLLVSSNHVRLGRLRRFRYWWRLCASDSQ